MTRRQTPVAVTGLACRFPGASGPDRFADMLEAGRSAIRELGPDRWDVDAIYDPAPGTPGRSYARHAGLIDDVDRFDAAAFGIAPKEAVAMDPQQRLLLEIAAEAFADAGLPRHRLNGSPVGVFVGLSTLDYMRLQPAGVAGVDAYSGSGNAISMAANRISYCFGLEGPSLAVDTACSSGLVAVDLAVQALERGEIDTALVAGANLILAPELMVAFSAARMLSPDGRCKTFDAGADGYVRGEGAGAVVLRKVEDARPAQDHIYARILGTAVNQDGRSNGLTAPNGPRQTAVVRAALERAGAVPSQLVHVEAHGTGTPLGDPIEILALADVFGDADPHHRCAVGSVKTNIGHLEAAAGVAGLMKTVLLLHRRRIPPSLNFDTPNPEIPFDQLPIDVHRSLVDWPDVPGAVAGVSSFGFGGTNAHAILAPAEPCDAPPAPRPAPWPLLVTGSSAAQLRHLAADLAQRLQADPDLLPALSATSLGRVTPGEFRAGFVVTDAADAVRILLAIGSAADAAPDDASGADAGAELLSTESTVRIVQRRRRRERTSPVPVAEGAPADWPADWPEPAQFVALLGCSPEPRRAAGSAATIVGAALTHAVRGQDLSWHKALPAMPPVRIRQEPWNRKLCWFDPARAPSVQGAAARWLAGLPVAGTGPGQVVLDGALPEDLPAHDGMVPFTVGLAAMTAAALTAVGPARLERIQFSRPVAFAARIELSAQVAGSAVVVATADGSICMQAEVVALPDWPEQGDPLGTSVPELASSGPAAALAQLLLRAAGRENRTGLPVAADAFLPGDPGGGPWALAGDAEQVQLASSTGAALLEGLRTAEPAIHVLRPVWIDIGWCPGPDFPDAVAQACARVPDADPAPQALEDGMTEAAADFARRALAAADASGMLHPALSRLRELASTSQASAPAEQITARLADAYPGHRDEIALFARCGAGWEDLLSGHSRNALQFLLDPDDPELLLRVYRDGPASRTPNAQTAAAAAAIVAARGADRPLTVLEIGAGTGATTAHLLPLLPDGSLYVATDLAAGQLTALAVRHADRPALQTRRLDATASFAAQGIGRGSIDLVVAANVLHSLKAPERCLGEIATALAPGGQLILQELTQRAAWLDLVFGLTEGWWSAARTDGPLLDPPRWHALLTSSGFVPVATAHPGPGQRDGAQAVIVAQPVPDRAVARRTDMSLSGEDPGSVNDDVIVAIPDTPGHLALARTRAAERSHLAAPILLVDPQDQQVPDTLPGAIEPQARLTGGRLQGFRLEPMRLRPQSPGQAAVLVLGGTGGIGRTVARHLAAHGAERVIIAGRSAAPDHPAVTGARAAAVSDGQVIEAARIDLGKPEAAAQLAKLLSEGVTHVVHAAGTDGMQHSDDLADSLQRARVAKVGGTRLLLLALADYASTRLVLLSSAAATLGLPGAAAYAIANAEAEDLVLAARASGRNASFVALGPVRDAGMATTAGAEQWHRFGVRLLEPQTVASAVATALCDPLAFPPSLLVDIDWPVAREFLAYGKDGRHLSLVMPDETAPDSSRDGGAEPRTAPGAEMNAAPPAARALQLAALPGTAQREAAEALVADSVAAVLGMADARTLRHDLGLNEIGLDSLTAVDLSGRLSKETGMTLAPTLAFDHPTVSSIAIHILDRLRPAEGTPPRPVHQAAPDRALSTAPDADVEQLLAMTDAEAWDLLVAEAE